MPHWLFGDLEGESKTFQNLAGEIIKIKKNYYLTAKGKIPVEVKLVVLGVLGYVIGRFVYERMVSR